jgi:hypothetical protein
VSQEKLSEERRAEALATLASWDSGVVPTQDELFPLFEYVRSLPSVSPRSADVQKALPGEGRREFLIWSNEHAAWWRPESRGYTDSIASAGLYTDEEATEICADLFPPRYEEKRHVSEVLGNLEAELGRAEKKRNDILATIRHIKNFMPPVESNEPR